MAPATVHVHSEISNKSNTVAYLKHGDHVQIVDVQRRMIRVRTEKGVEGWLDSLQLLSAAQMDELRKQHAAQALLPAEGTATAFEALNVHLEPDRQSPSFVQIPEGGSVTILGHKVTPKVSTAAKAPALVLSRPQPMTRKQKKEQQSKSIASLRLPPKPAPPKPPANWVQLSAERIDGGGDEPDITKDKPEKPEKPVVVPKVEKPVVVENWTLIRTKNKEIGWVLTRNLQMSIPDEVAQYAEGKLITGFFDLGLVNDEVKGPRHNWLWTTAAHTLPNDFDSWRVFLWNPRRHRYETSFRQRDLEGYFPVMVDAAESGSPLRTFHLITKDDDGKMRQRSYTFDGHRVHLADTQDYSAATGTKPAAAGLSADDLASKAKPPNWFKRQWGNIKRRISSN